MSAWARALSASQYLAVGFQTPVNATSVTIRESCGNGFVTRLDLIDTSNISHTVWSGVDPAKPGALTDFQINFAATLYLVKGVKIYIDTNRDLGSWEEIDAVQLRGNTPVYSPPSPGGGYGYDPNAPKTPALPYPPAVPSLQPGVNISGVQLIGSVVTIFCTNGGRLDINTMTLPPGNGASLPTWLNPVIKNIKKHFDKQMPEVWRVHDYLYSKAGQNQIHLTRDQADQIMRRMMEAKGFSSAASTIYAQTSQWGWLFWE